MQKNSYQQSGTLFSTIVPDEWYHIMLDSVVVKDVLHTTREQSNSSMVYNTLYDTMERMHIRALWVHPDTQLSIWMNAGDFNMVEGLDIFVPKEPPHHTGLYRPYCIRMSKPQGGDRFIYFPAYGEWVRKHKDTEGWLIPSPDHLFNTVLYIERATAAPLHWTPGNSGIMTLRRELTHVLIDPFVDTTGLWASELGRKIVTRPSWVYHTPDGKRGLNPQWLRGEWYVHKLDKRCQYLGACVGTDMGNGGYVETDNYTPDAIGFWEYELQDVSDTPFNGLTLPCPLNFRETWASGHMLETCRKYGIRFTPKRGIVWQERVTNPMGKWARKLFDSREELLDPRKYPDTIAAMNAYATLKKYYLDVTGRLCEPYSKELFHPDWNRIIVNKAVANMMGTFWSRPNELWHSTILVDTDSFVVIDQYPDVRCNYASLLQHTTELRGYVHKGSCMLNDEIITAFREESSNYNIAATIKKGLDNATTR